MYALSKDVIGGYNKLIDDQKAIPGEANFTLVLFDTQTQTIYENLPIQKVPKLTDKEYFPTGATALLDTVGAVITSMGKRLAGTPEEQRPGKVIVAIMTDGEENSSKKFTKSQIKEMIETQQKTYKWEFLFIGAGIDAFSEAGGIGISASCTRSMSHDSKGMAGTFGGISARYSATRSR